MAVAGKILDRWVFIFSLTKQFISIYCNRLVMSHMTPPHHITSQFLCIQVITDVTIFFSCIFFVVCLLVSDRVMIYIYTHALQRINGKYIYIYIIMYKLYIKLLKINVVWDGSNSGQSTGEAVSSFADFLFWVGVAPFHAESLLTWLFQLINYLIINYLVSSSSSSSSS